MYRRVSTDDQKEFGYSLQDQKERITSYCERNNWEIIADYQDDFSAKTFNRPSWELLLKDVSKKQIRPEIIVVTRADRFSRSASESLQMLLILKKSNIKVFSLNENCFLDLDNPQTFLQNFFSLGMAEYDNITRADNTKRGMRQAAREGRTMGKAPKGYINNKIYKTVEIDPVDGPLIKEGFDLLKLGIYTMEDIRRKLVKKGLKNCSKQTFLNIVRNKYYYGIVKVPESRDEASMEVVGLHSPLISKEDYDIIQSIYFGKSKKSNTINLTNEELPLRGFLLCKLCGSTLTGSGSKSRNGNRYYYYHCQNGCKERFRADEANSLFINFLQNFQIKESVIRLYRQIVSDLYSENDEARIKELNAVNDDINKCKLRLSSLQDKYLDNMFAVEDYKSIKSRLEDELNLLNNKKAELNIDQETFKEYLDFCIDFLKNLGKEFGNSSVEIKRKIIGSIINGKIIFDNKKYRTASINSLISLITLNINELGEIKNGQKTISSNLSTYAPPLGLEPRTL
ncbi:hypothetical protein FLACOL_01585 [Flavobacterium columnare]|nr:hypothetical protein FLACOL_01585 [Flavobacterium columnare]